MGLKPPPLEQLPHELATFVVHVQLVPNADDDLAAKVESAAVEVTAEELVDLAGSVKARLEELLPDLAERLGVTLPDSPVIIDLQPEGMIEPARRRLIAD